MYDFLIQRLTVHLVQGYNTCNKFNLDDIILYTYYISKFRISVNRFTENFILFPIKTPFTYQSLVIAFTIYIIYPQ